MRNAVYYFDSCRTSVRPSRVASSPRSRCSAAPGDLDMATALSSCLATATGGLSSSVYGLQASGIQNIQCHPDRQRRLRAETMHRRPGDVHAAIDAAIPRDLGADETVVATVVGVAHASLHKVVRGLVVTDRRALLLQPRRRRACVADCPRYAVQVTESAATHDGMCARLVVDLAGKRFAIDVPASERARAAAVLQALGHAASEEHPVASLRRVDLTRRSRRDLRIGLREHTAVVVTDRHVVFLARRSGHAKVALRCPRDAVRVLDYETVWPGGDLVFDHMVMKAGDATLSFDLDGRMHERAEAVVAALGGVHAG